MYKRILLKLSGEALADKNSNQTLNTAKLNDVAKQIKTLVDLGVKVGVVIGAGNIWRGKFASSLGIDPAEADYMGMLGTIINCVALSSCLKNIGVKSKVYSAIYVEPITEKFEIEPVNKDLDDNVIVVFAGGTGKPFFTTDTAATLRAIQINADAILMAKNGVDGVYDSDPNSNVNAKKFDDLTLKDIKDLKLGVMDMSAVNMLFDQNIDLLVFNMDKSENIVKVAKGEKIGTVIKKG